MTGKLIQNFNENSGPSIRLPVVSFGLLSLNKTTRHFNRHKHFKNYIDLNFEYNNDIIRRQNKMYTILVPPFKYRHNFKSNYLMVFRIDMKNNGNLCVTLSNLTHNLRVSFY